MSFYQNTWFNERGMGSNPHSFVKPFIGACLIWFNEWLNHVAQIRGLMNVV